MPANVVADLGLENDAVVVLETVVVVAANTLTSGGD